MPTPDYIPIGCDCLLTITGEKDAVGSYVNTATVTWNLYDDELNLITSGTLTADGLNVGGYSGTIGRAVTSALVNGNWYFLDTVLTTGIITDERRLKLQALYRGKI